MNILILIICMIFCHVVADYNLQGWLASAKQKSYWEENAPDKMYRYDYICALITHSFSWTFLTMVPIFVYNKFAINIDMFIVGLFNIIVHAVVDDLKANKKQINLWEDQTIHLYQIVLTAVLCSV